MCLLSINTEPTHRQNFSVDKLSFFFLEVNKEIHKMNPFTHLFWLSSFIYLYFSVIFFYKFPFEYEFFFSLVSTTWPSWKYQLSLLNIQLNFTFHFLWFINILLSWIFNIQLNLVTFTFFLSGYLSVFLSYSNFFSDFFIYIAILSFLFHFSFYSVTWI